MHITEKEIEKYLSEIRSNLVCNRKTQNLIARDIEGLVYDYAEAKGVTDISELYEHFGTPEEMAKTQMSQIDPKKINKAMKIKKAVVIGIIAALIMLALSLVISLADAHYNHIGYVEQHVAVTDADVSEYCAIDSESIVIEYETNKEN